ncbi:hypothetical protein ACFWCF_12925 [Rhodococcus sp. NPDC060090]|uniref:hypothetical protein n=1 Tax=Rhodococcus sp. NPDC060090 TaxID=3347056 RepID=UPI003660C392
MSADELTQTEILVLLTLMAESRPVTNTELKSLGPELRADSRRKLNRLELVDTNTSTRPFTHELADNGWARCYELLSAGAPPRATPAARTLYTVLSSLGRHFARNDLRPADVFLPAPVEKTPENPAREVVARTDVRAAPVEGRIREVYSRLASRPGKWVGLADLRSALTDIAKDDLDRELVRMYRLPDIHLVPDENQKMLTAQDRAAAVTIGNQDKHALAIETQ